MPVPKRHRPKLGQHFLADPRYRRRLAEAISLSADDLVIEIGPGRGAMTGLLAERARYVVAIELDAALADQLKSRMEGDPRIEILQGDILSTDLKEICRRYGNEKCYVFGNLPYYVTSPILHHLFDSRAAIRAMALVVQREVAERITASPRSRAYGYLSVLTALSLQPRALFDIPPGAFAPPPKVQSTLVEFLIRPRFPEWNCHTYARFLGFVKSCFAQKRKSLLNNLRGIYPRRRVEEALAAVSAGPCTLGSDRCQETSQKRAGSAPSKLRAEQLTLEELVALFKVLPDEPQKL
jgi:16S rRNA (adenine1518-N6/adenine1519-N6)-dimethyltransferase